MNKNLKYVFEERGFTVEGNSAYGFLCNYETNFLYSPMNSQAPIKLHIAFYGTEECRRMINEKLCSAKLRHCKFTFTMYGLLFVLNALTVGKIVSELPSLFDTVCGILSSSGAENRHSCPRCGKSLDTVASERRDIDGLKVTLDMGCIDDINAVIAAENEDFDKAPNNYLRGFFGAFIGALAGAVIAVVLYLIGFVSAISAIVAISAGAFLYQKFKGKPNKIMIVIVTVTSFAVLMLSILIIYLVASGIAAAEAGLDISAFEAFGILLGDAEIRNAFIIDMVLTFVFSAIGAVVQIVTLSKMTKRKTSI